MRENNAIRQIAVTTNGYRLARDVQRWRDAGLTAVNVSVDSLDARQFHAITGQDKFQQVMDGIDAAFAAGFEKVKVNTVLMRDVNHHQLDTFLAWIKPRRIQLRFIELMETGEGRDLFAVTTFPAWCCAMNCCDAVGSTRSVNEAMARHRSFATRITPVISA